MKHIILTLATLFLCCLLKAQPSNQNTKTPVQFQSILQAGLLAGKTESSYTVQSINGIRWKTFSGGIGIGIDDYVFRTIPLFVDLRADVLNKKNTPFIFVNTGRQFCWLQSNQKNYNYFNPEYKAGFYVSTGAGYKLNILKKNALIISAAFSLKKVTETESPYCNLAACPEAPAPLVNKYTFRRLALTAGWILW